MGQSRTTKETNEPRIGKLEQAMNELMTLRDEIRLNVHLAEMDAKSEWDALQPKLHDLESKVAEGSTKAVKLATDVGATLRDLKNRMSAPRVATVMSSQVFACSAHEPLHRPLQLMWEHDIGVVPVYDEDRPIAVVTDRDIVMAGYTRGGLDMSSAVRGVMSQSLHTCSVDRTIVEAMTQMREACVRRLLVVNDDNELVGLLSLGDIARWAKEADATGYLVEVGETLAAISNPRT